VVDDPQVQTSESVIERTHEVMGDHLLPDIVPSYSRTPGSISDAPTLGGNTDEILTSIGFSEAELDNLRANNIVD
jgi:formyl-CoA transferase